MPVPFSAVASADRHDAIPDEPSGAGVLLLAGSSGRVEVERAALLARHGIRTRAVRWFGGEGQRPVPFEVPIELFLDQLDELRRECDRVSVVGTSFGAEAALVTATLTPLHAVVAISPSSVVWGGVHEGIWSSHWTVSGAPLPWVRFDDGWMPDADPPAYLSLYRSSLALDEAVTDAAAIPVEHIDAPVLLTAGGDDQVWPATEFAERIALRRAASGLRTEVISSPEAGHRLVLPGESAAASGTTMQRGGSEQADRTLGERVWPRLLQVVR